MGTVKFRGVMMSKNKQIQEQSNDIKSTLNRSLLTGFIGGILSSAFGVFMYYFNFSEVSPKDYVLRVWIKSEWTSGWIGDLMSIFITGLLSVLVALMYFVLFRKVYAIWLGGLYGVIIWFFIFFVFPPLFSDIQKIVELNQNTIISTLCLFLLYGIFIGYSISYDYFDTNVLEDEGSQE